MERARIFISYCHDDIDAQILDLFISNLSKDTRLEVITDRLIRAGDDLIKFMELLKNCPTVLILCTPAYYRRIADRRGGVYTEYKAIVECHEQLNDEFKRAQTNSPETIDPLKGFVDQIRDDRFSIVPVLLSGTVETSIPTQFQNKAAANLVGMVTTTWRSTGEIRPSVNYRNAFDNLIKSIITTATDITAIRQSDQTTTSKTIFNKIFFELKHDAQTLNMETIRDVFVKTLEFRRVSDQQAYLLVGRKGSGKSTLADFLTYGPTTKWKTPILYNVDDLPLNFMFSIISEAPHRSDQRHVITGANAMKFAWEALFHYLCFEVLLIELREHKLKPEQALRVERIKDALLFLDNQQEFDTALAFISKLKSVQMARHHAFFCYALSKSLKFVSDIIHSAPDEEALFQQYIVRNLTPEHFIVSLFSFNKEFLPTFYEVLRLCERNFMIALDGFDSNFQQFRFETFRSYRDTDVFEFRNRFEQDWLSGLISAVRRCKRRIGTAPTSDKVDFCVTIPKDRFVEFIEYDRDAYEWERRRVDISWTGIELSILLRKRLEVYKRYTSSKSLRPLSRLTDVLRGTLSWVPNRIPIPLESTTVEVDLFQYLLRHSFWRPRDILFFSGRLIAAAEYYKAHGLEFDAQTVKLIVSRSLDAIINLEFIKEFNGSVENVEVVIRKFERGPQVMTIEEFYRRVDGVRLVRALPSELSETERQRLNHQEKILHWLYNVGFIGFYLNGGSIATQRYETPWVFVFNEGSGILDMLPVINHSEARLVIHPIFIEFLGLVPFRGALVCEYGHDYLVRQEARQMASVS